MSPDESEMSAGESAAQEFKAELTADHDEKIKAHLARQAEEAAAEKGDDAAEKGDDKPQSPPPGPLNVHDAAQGDDQAENDPAPEEPRAPPQHPAVAQFEAPGHEPGAQIDVTDAEHGDVPLHPVAVDGLGRIWKFVEDGAKTVAVMVGRL